MNSFERVKATIEYERVDRIPVIPEVAGVTAKLCGKSVRDYVTDGAVIAGCQLNAQEHFQYDAVFAFADLCVEPEAIGCTLTYPADNYPHVKQPVMQSISDLDKLSVPDPLERGRMPEIIKAVKILKNACQGKVPVVAHALAPLTIASRIMDIEKFLYAIVDEPNNFKRLLSYTCEVALEFIKHLLEAGADSIIMFNPSASPAILPPKIFREFELPNLAKIYGFIKKQYPEIITWYSVAGATQEIIKDMENINLDVMTIDYLVPLDVAFDLSSSLCFNGNIKSLSFVNESSEDIFTQSTELVHASLERGRFILGAGCEIPPNATPDTITAMVNASHAVSQNYKTYGKNGKGMKCISFSPYQRKVYVKEDIGLIEAAALAGIHIPQLCNKSGVCGSCIVQLEKSAPIPYSKKEDIVLTSEQKEKNYRLACLFRVSSDLDVYVPKESRTDPETMVYTKDVSLQFIDNLANEYVMNPSIQVIPVSLEKKSDSQPDVEVICAATGKGVNISPIILQKLPNMIRGNKPLFCILDSGKNAVVDISHSRDAFGVALDIGTTTIAIYIHNLETGKLVAYGSSMNPQFYFGDNIITRAQQYMSDESGKHVLRNSLLKGINSLIMKITRNACIDYNHIYKMIVVGNSVMHHMFLGFEIEYLVKSPFVPVLLSRYEYTNMDTYTKERLAMNENGRIVFPPLLNGFVGSDLVAGIIASELYRSEKPVLYVDLGTNGELVIGNKDRIIATSVAAGPAFERSYVASGRTAGHGIIYKLDIHEDLTIHYATYKGSKPSGLCGSAIIDAIAAFLRLGIINQRGYFVKKPQFDNLRNDRYILVPKQETAFFQPLVISARDIEEVQKAKAGIMAGIFILLKEYGIRIEDIDKLILTGSFGMNLNVKNAIRIGLLPDISTDKIECISNAAGIGAQMCLLFKETEGKIEDILDKIEHINVANHNEFNNVYIDSMQFDTSA